MTEFFVHDIKDIAFEKLKEITNSHPSVTQLIATRKTLDLFEEKDQLESSSEVDSSEQLGYVSVDVDLSPTSSQTPSTLTSSSSQTNVRKKKKKKKKKKK